MILVDFRNWKFDKSLGILPNAQEQLLQKDFETLTNVKSLEVLDVAINSTFSVTDLFFKNEHQIAVSAVKNIESYYKVIDKVLELENKEVIDYTTAAEEEVFFYGSNSLVSHLNSEIALCGVNEFSDESLFEEYCEDFELTPFSFNLPEGLFTRDMAFFTKNTLLICMDYIADKKIKKQLFSMLKSSGINIVTFTKEQIAQGVLNLVNINNQTYIAKSSYNLFTPLQKKAIPNIMVLDLPFLEKAKIKLRDIIL